MVQDFVRTPVLSFAAVPFLVCSSFGMVSATFDNERYRNQQRKAIQRWNCYQKVIICLAVTAAPNLCPWRRNFCAAGGVLFSYSGAIFERSRSLFSLTTVAQNMHDLRRCPCEASATFSVPIIFRNGHKAPLNSLGHLRLREPRRQPLQKFAQKAPQPTALKPPSTARTAGRSDWAERRFRRQPFILLSFSSSKKP